VSELEPIERDKQGEQRYQENDAYNNGIGPTCDQVLTDVFCPYKGRQVQTPAGDEGWTVQPGRQALGEYRREPY